ncbi:TRAP transporter large permease subunit [Sansalvadorimonas sp. 2012CJ34-2]|uniref:TRAP transporter large permease protein n=1 Tax=Parendozoicomonas callyspongiae TaxID=2942213 RepID=A0ABT0PGB2_9GAMM|nr:TRAP transporter large permease subunit [Sansalvadorimonas sp. 2012CJ34-2]MCL6270425.1 TRAP transporter large permease subunit [Sansalvadorimonas sp. 2012CJ34-2]
MAASTLLVLFICFFILLFLGVPISFAIGISSLSSLLLALPFDTSVMVIAQKLQSGLSSFALLAIPFFILAGVLMNRGGIALRLINLSQVLAGRLPGSLAHVNVIANMMFGSISGSAVASAAAVGSAMTPEQRKAGYDPNFSAAINAASCPTGLLIPPSNVMIIYALSSGGVSVAALFLAGYLPGLLMGLSVMLIAALIAVRKQYPKAQRPTLMMAAKALIDALPSLFLIVIVMGGIIGGIFTATEASAIAVAYAFTLSVLIYRDIKFRELPQVFLEAAVTSSIVLLLIAVSAGMSWVMINADLIYLVNEGLLSLSSNPVVVMLIINLVLLVVGVFMDMTPAVLIFTPVFLPVVTELGISPLHFGIVMIFNLCIGLITPPVGSALFVGCSVADIKIQDILRPMLPIYALLFITLLLVTYIPAISLFLPRLFGLA